MESVYNLTVIDGEPAYLAEGVVVHNCDAARYLVMGVMRARGGIAPDIDATERPSTIANAVPPSNPWRT